MRWISAAGFRLAGRVCSFLRNSAVLSSAAVLLAVLGGSPTFAATERDFFPLTLDTRELGVTIVGYVWDDFNSKAVHSAVVQLTGPGGETVSTTTSSTGLWRFDQLDSAVYPQPGSTVRVSHTGYFDAQQALAAGVSPILRMRTRTVVLIHGINSNVGAWGGQPEDLPARLEAAEYNVVGLDAGGFPANVGRIQSVLSTMSGQLDEACLDAGIQSFDVVAHSMGGLVARSYLHSPKGRDRIQRLITLGTPHHGSYIANAIVSGAIAIDVGLSIWSGTPFRFLSLAASTTGLVDLAVGSPYLTSLNYGRFGDDQADSKCRTNFDERVEYGNTAIFSIAGTQPGIEFGILEVFAGCWSLYSDGVVLVPRAIYHDGYYSTDLGLGCPDRAHHKGFDDSEPGLMKSPCIVGKVVELLGAAGLDSSNLTDDAAVARRLEGPRTTLPVIAGHIQPGGALELTTQVDAMSVADFVCMSPADSLNYALRSPSGLLIDPAYAAISPEAEYTQVDGAAMYTVTAPEAGQWIHMISTFGSAEPDSFHIVTSFDGHVTLTASVEGGIEPSEAFTLRAEFREALAPIPTGAVSVEVTRPDGGVVTASLLDDGIGMDEVAGDGIYTATHPAGGAEGMFTFTFLASVDPSDPASEMREDRQVAWASSLPDVAVGEGGVIFDAAPLPLGGVLRSTAVFTNHGAAVADSVLLRLENMTFGAVLAESLVTNLGPGQSVTLEADWLGVQVGTFAIRGSVDLVGLQLEADLGNNFAEAAIEVAYADGVTSVPGNDPGIDDPTDTISSNVLLRPGHPNPMQGNRMTIGFRVPSGAGEVELAVFDVRGRRVRAVVSETLPPGEHERIWDGRDRTGAPVASGVYFWRLAVGGQVEIQKMVVLR